MKKINSSKQLQKTIKVTNDYESDLKKANAKGYTFSKTLHEMINLKFI